MSGITREVVQTAIKEALQLNRRIFQIPNSTLLKIKNL